MKKIIFIISLLLVLASMPKITLAATPTPTPSLTITPTSTPSGTLTPTITRIPTLATTATPSAESLPQTGTITPTLILIGLGILILTSGLVLLL